MMPDQSPSLTSNANLTDEIAALLIGVDERLNWTVATMLGEDVAVVAVPNVSSSSMDFADSLGHFVPPDDPYSGFQLQYVLPFSNHDNGSLMAIAAFYALLFMLGTCGNAAILAVVHHVRARHNTTLTYICILCIVDFLSMLPLPMTIIDQVLGFWMFGTFACKLFRLLEHIGKIFSTFILVAFSIDRYCAVCHPLQIRVRSHRTVYTLLGTMFIVTCFMLFPILLFAHSKELVVHEKIDMPQRTITRLHLYKCVDDLGDALFVVFTLYCFLFAYLMPLLLMIYFYYGMLWRLFKQSRAVRQTLLANRNGRKGIEEKIPVLHIAVYTLAICLFHFICWTPYWISVLYSLYLELAQHEMTIPSPAFIYFMYGVHALPYINSASNFILYGLLNRQFSRDRDQLKNKELTLQLHQTGQEKKTTTTVCTARSVGGGRTTPQGVAPAMRLTECSDVYNNEHVYDSAVVRTPPSEASPRTLNECSPLVLKQHSVPDPKGYVNGFVTMPSRDTMGSIDNAPSSIEEESVVI